MEEDGVPSTCERSQAAKSGASSTTWRAPEAVTVRVRDQDRVEEDPGNPPRGCKCSPTARDVRRPSRPPQYEHPLSIHSEGRIMRRRVDGRVRSVGGLLLAGAMVLAVGVPASAQVTVEELCNVVAAEAGAEGPAASPAVEAAASPAVAAASPAVEGTTGMSQVTAELLLELCTRAGLGAVASPAAAEASAAAMESAAAIEASAAPMASPAASPAA